MTLLRVGHVVDLAEKLVMLISQVSHLTRPLKYMTVQAVTTTVRRICQLRKRDDRKRQHQELEDTSWQAVLVLLFYICKCHLDRGPGKRIRNGQRIAPQPILMCTSDSESWRQGLWIGDRPMSHHDS